MRNDWKQIVVAGVCLLGNLGGVFTQRGSGLTWAATLAAEDTNNVAETIGKYLAIGAAGGQLPTNFVVTIRTHGYPTEESGKTNMVFEAWRFTPDSVSQLNAKQQVVAGSRFRRIREVCQALVNGDLMALHDAPRGRGRENPVLTLLGTSCAGGVESITVTVEGDALHVIGQSCWGAGFADEKDQQRFQELYGRLRACARDALVDALWGAPVKGLELGIAPPVRTNGVAYAMFDGENLCARVFCRNTGKDPVRLLASVHTCLLGKGGNNALLASGIILTPKNGGASFTVTYQGWNHLALLDKRRENGEQPQQTLNKSLGGKTDIELTKEDADHMTTVLEPGETGRVVQVHFTPNREPRSWWWLENDSVILTSGTYQVTAFFTADHQFSDWKGTIKSESLEVEIAFPNHCAEHKRESPTKPSTATE